jgi:hypothetical protein
VTGANGNRIVLLLLLAVAGTPIVSVEEPSAVTDVGEKLHVAPEGSPEQVNETDPANPFNAPTMMLALPDPPLETVSEAGFKVREKSGGGVVIMYVADASELTAWPGA